MADETAPSELTAHLGYWLRTVSNAVSHGFARKVEAEGVTVAEWVFLRVLYDVETMSPSELAARMGMTRGAISKLADRLVEKALVTRDAQTDGPGRQALGLTPAARARVPRLAALADRNDAEFFASLSPDERGELDRILRKLVAARALTNVPVD